MTVLNVMEAYLGERRRQLLLNSGEDIFPPIVFVGCIRKLEVQPSADGTACEEIGLGASETRDER